jgi:hypothetical protein
MLPNLGSRLPRFAAKFPAGAGRGFLSRGSAIRPVRNGKRVEDLGRFELEIPDFSQRLREFLS